MENNNFYGIRMNSIEDGLNQIIKANDTEKIKKNQKNNFKDR
jgi:hypothetical protein